MFQRIQDFPDEKSRFRRLSLGQQSFEIAYFERIGTEEFAAHAVSDLGVVDEVTDALRLAFVKLVSPPFGWRSRNQDASTTCRVKLKNLGPKILGAAITGNLGTGEALPYLVLNVRALESNRQAAISRRRATIAHELCHLLQFETAAFQYWPSRGRFGLGDPNWWLHEASALAVESAICHESPECFPLFWEWATIPSRSLDVDDAGGTAAPFLMYLMRALPDGSRIPADLYSIEPRSDASMSGTDLLEAVLKSRGTRLAAVSGEDCFASRYCVDAAFVGSSDSLLDPRILDVVGPRCIADVFERFPVQSAGLRCPVDHLGCRYFQFRIPSTQHGLRITVAPDLSRGPNMLRCELVVIGHDGRKLRQETLIRRESDSSLEIITPVDPRTDGLALLVVANCAWGSDARRYDQQTFSISAASL